MIPSAKSCAPEKIAITDARNGKPGTTLPWITQRPITHASTAKPNSVKPKPTRLAICSGNVLSRHHVHRVIDELRNV